MGHGRDGGVLPDRDQTDYKTHRKRGVEDPTPIPVAKSSQQQKEEDEMEPGPHSTHPLEVPEEAVRGRRREERGERCGSEKRHQGPENRLATKVQRIPPEAERQDQRGSSDFDLSLI